MNYFEQQVISPYIPLVQIHCNVHDPTTQWDKFEENKRGRDDEIVTRKHEATPPFTPIGYCPTKTGTLLLNTSTPCEDR